jgi:hypothetical protein
LDFVVGNSNKLQELGLEGKISLSPKCVQIAKLEIFNDEDVKNK